MRKSKEEIIAELGASFNGLCNLCENISEEVFNRSHQNKWSPAENFQHLVTATKMTSLAFTLPKFLHVFLYGKPRRTSHVYSKVVERYQQKLNEGATASGVYVPKKTDYKKNELKARLESEGSKLITALNGKWTDEQLDNYQISHPILELLTIRELAYFTIYHNNHHLETVQKHYL
ncbi:MAG: DinB family protein [Chitinophagales bacterium]|nr:DinB family protein [Chitinophagales bacterium]